MTIVLLTALWPKSVDAAREDGTFAVFELVRSWTLTDRLLVFRLTRTPWKPSAWRQREAQEFAGCTVVHTPLGPEFWGRSWINPTVLWVKEWLASHNVRPDVILTHFRSSHLVGPRLQRAFPSAAHVAGIHQFDLGRLAKRPSFRRALDGADGVAFRSPALRERARDWGDWEAKSFLALSGVSADWLAGKRPARRRGSPLRVGTVGRLIERKKVDIVLQAMARLEPGSWSLDIVGDGPCRGALEKLADELGVQAWVRFRGALRHHEVKACLDDWDVFAMPSDRETFGLAYLEALARGCLVIGARGWGIDGIVVDGKSGFLVPLNDTEALTRRMVELRDAPEDVWDQWRTEAWTLIADMTESARSADYRAFLERTWRAKNTGD